MISKVKIIFIAAMFISVVCPGCYAGITGKVIDAETQQPIEGAVVLIEWTKTKGVPGMTHTESAKVIEAVTDNEGKVYLSGVWDPMLDNPSVTVYKKGYVAWNNEYIFPDYKKRTDFKWKNGYVFRLEKFITGYTHDAHTSFISSCIHSSLSKNYELKKPIFSAIEWEEKLALQERLNKKQP